jgi:hypothetical protein
MKRLYSNAEYAGIRQCSIKTPERERAAGTGCPYVQIGRRIYYREEDIEAFLAARVRNSTSQPAPDCDGMAASPASRNNTPGRIGTSELAPSDGATP